MNIQEQQSGADAAKVFFALWPSPTLRRSLHAVALQYQKQYGGRAMRMETLHLTLLFLGTLERARIARLQELVDTFGFAAFTFSLQQVACWQHNRIAYATSCDEVVPLQSLSQNLRILTEHAGAGFDRRAFTPHVTLLRRVATLAEPQPIRLPEWRVEAFSLVESLTDEQGVRYRNLRTWHCRE